MGSTVTRLHQEELEVTNESLRLHSPELVSSLRELLGAQLVAYIGGVSETRAVREWADGVREPRPEAEKRLRMAYRIASLLSRHESRRTVHAWFQGLNPMLDDRAPARVLRDGDVDEEGRLVLLAARALATAA